MIVSGKVLDNATREPIQYATVSLHIGDLQLVALSADRNGDFTISSPYQATAFKVSAVGFTPRSWVLPDMAGLYVWELSRVIKTEPEVIVTSGQQRGNTWWIIAGVVMLMIMAKKFRG